MGEYQMPLIALLLKYWEVLVGHMDSHSGRHGWNKAVVNSLTKPNDDYDIVLHRMGCSGLTSLTLPLSLSITSFSEATSLVENNYPRVNLGRKGTTKHGIRTPKPRTQNPKSETRPHKPNPKPKIPKPKPLNSETLSLDP